MKKLLTILTLAFLSSCVYTPATISPAYTVYYSGSYYYQAPPPQRNCTCGYIIDKGVDQWGYYFLDVQNQCSGNIKRFSFDKNQWVNFRISESICMTQNSSW